MAAYGSGDVVTGFGRFALAALYTRVLDPDQFGVLAVLYVSISLAAMVIPFGLPSVLMVRFGEQGAPAMRRNKDEVYTKLVLFALPAGVLTAAAGGVLPGLHADMAPWAAVWLVAGVLWFVPAQSLRYKHAATRYSLSRASHIVVMATVAAWLYAAGKLTLTGIVAAEALGAGAALLAAHFADGYLPRPAWPEGSRVLLALGLPFCLLELVHFVVDWSDRYVITALMGVAATGYYAVASRLSIVGAMVVTAFIAVWQPYFYRLAGSDQVAPRTVGLTARRLLLIVGAAIGALMLVIPELVVLEVAGTHIIDPAYAGTKVLVAPLLLQYFFKAAYFVATPAINFNGRTWWQVAIIAAAGLANVFGNVLVITLWPAGSPYPPLVAVALVTAACYVFAMIFAFRELDRLYPCVRPSYTLVIAATVLVTVPLLPLSLALRTALFGLGAVAAGGALLHGRRNGCTNSETPH
ncbi:MAG: oligosaccharide flippase family protein [Chitinivibrionales bacterium]|nr:oligosaccharide flippase family protein [Chitinivibrionales bacterium]